MMNKIATFHRDTVAVASASHPSGHGPSGAVPNPLPKLLTGEDLPIEDSEHLFERLVLGKLEPAEIAGMLIALRMKGETAEEMIGAARALSAAAQPFDRPDYLYADCCGTGGDGSGLINVSTATAFVAVASGLPIAKHGNRSVSSRCGSADVLEAVGAKIDLPAAEARALLDETGFCFLFAPAYHPGMKHAALVRRQLEVRTIMNLLGPCINPARPLSSCSGLPIRRCFDVLRRPSPQWESSRRWWSMAPGSTRLRCTRRPVQFACRAMTSKRSRLRRRMRGSNVLRSTPLRAAMSPRMPQGSNRCSVDRLGGRSKTL